MRLKIIFFILAICSVFIACSTESAESTVTQDEIKEIQSLDSLNQQLEKNTLEIEENIQSVEAAVSELDNF